MKRKFLIRTQRPDGSRYPIIRQVFARYAQRLTFVEQRVCRVYILAQGKSRVVLPNERRQERKGMILVEHLILIPSKIW